MWGAGKVTVKRYLLQVCGIYNSSERSNLLSLWSARHLQWKVLQWIWMLRIDKRFAPRHGEARHDNIEAAIRNYLYSPATLRVNIDPTHGVNRKKTCHARTTAGGIKNQTTSWQALIKTELTLIMCYHTIITLIWILYIMLPRVQVRYWSLKDRLCADSVLALDQAHLKDPYLNVSTSRYVHPFILELSSPGCCRMESSSWLFYHTC